MIDLRLSLLVLGCVVFGGLIVAELNADPGEPFATAAVTPRRDEAPPPPPNQQPRLEDLLATTLARPLFSPTRRPAANIASEAVGASDLAGNWLAGIVIEPDRRLAIFAVAGAKPLIVAEGDNVSGWQVESITPTEVSLVSRGGTKTLQPTLDPNLSAPAKPPARANAAAQPPGAPGHPPGPPIRPVIPPPNPAAAQPPQPARPVAQANQAPRTPPTGPQAVPGPGPRVIGPGPQR